MVFWDVIRPCGPVCAHGPLYMVEMRQKIRRIKKWYYACNITAKTCPFSIIMDHIKTKLQWQLCVLLVVACNTNAVSAQNTNGLGKGGCSFLDDQNVYNIELMRGTHQAPCPSLNSLNDDFKQTEDKISETAYELSRIQTRIVDLLDLNNQLTAQVHNVQDELRATLYSLKSGDVGEYRYNGRPVLLISIILTKY